MAKKKENQTVVFEAEAFEEIKDMYSESERV